jgi:hypothetical protein
VYAQRLAGREEGERKKTGPSNGLAFHWKPRTESKVQNGRAHPKDWRNALCLRSINILEGFMPTKAQGEAQKIYANLLGEINLRIASINHCTLGQSGAALERESMAIIAELTAYAARRGIGHDQETRA